MLNDYSVDIIYKNKDMIDVNEKHYSLEEYCQEMKSNMTKIIMDVENVFYMYEGNKSKRNWSEGSIVAFEKIRHKILDTANAAARLPSSLKYKGQNINSVPMSNYFADIINKS